MISVQINPAEASSYYQRGIVYQKMKKSQEAKNDFQKALQLDSSLIEARQALNLIK